MKRQAAGRLTHGPPVPRPLWVAELRWTDRAAGKVASKHGWRQHDVDDALVCQAGLRAREDNDPIRGLRLLVECTVDGRPALAVLRPTLDVDVFWLVTVYAR